MKEPKPPRDFSVPKVLASRAAASPGKPFLTELASGRRWTYGEFHRWSDAIAASLHAQGLVRGAHVGVLMDNSAAHIGLFFALARLGAVQVPVNTAARGDLLCHYLRQADVTHVVVDAAHAARLDEALRQLPALQVIVVTPPADDAAGAWRFGEEPVADAGPRRTLAPDDSSTQDLLLLAYTSGTTGPSKASMVSHGSALAYGTGGIEAHGFTADDVFYVCLPLFHVNALFTSTLTAVVAGASVVLAPRFSASRFFDEIRGCGATTTNLLGAMAAFLWAQPERPDDAEHRLRVVSMSPLPADTPAFEKRFGLAAVTNYGLSDFGTVTSLRAGAPRDKLGSIGLPRSLFDVRIFDESDFECGNDVVGEIVIRARAPWCAATGYYGMPEATVAAHRNQWFHTGDRGRRDADGYLWFVDRKKDCIRRRGENISAFEVERVLQSHPQVAAAAVFPVRTEHDDEEVGAAVVLREGAGLREADLVAHCAAHMAYFMVPRYVSFLAELPTTMNQKIEKFRLREQMQRGLDTVWDREAAGIRLSR